MIINDYETIKQQFIKNTYNLSIYNKMNLDYNRHIISYEDQTNKTINKIMNNFINKYKNDFDKKQFILLYNDDIFSLIAYYILKNIQGLYNFNLKIKGKRQNTKKHINRKLFVNKFKRYKDVIYISCDNPLYKVKNKGVSFNKLKYNDSYKIIDRFTPDQFVIISKFYSINDLELLSEFSKDYFIEFQRAIIDIDFTKYFDYFDTKEKILFLVKLEGNENDFKIFDKIINIDKPIIFCYNKEKYNFLNENLNPFIRNSNIIRQDINTIPEENYDKFKELLNRFGIRYEIGNNSDKCEKWEWR